MKLGRWFLPLALLLPLALIPACGGGGGSSSNRTFVAFISNNPAEFWTIARKGTEKASAEFGVECEFHMPAGGNSTDQRRIIEDLRTKGVKAIAISPNDSANQVEFFKELNAKIPVIAVDNDIPDADARKCYIGTDNVTAGRATGKLVKHARPEGGKIMIFVGKLDSQNAQERRHGVVVELAGGEENCKAQLEQLKAEKYPVTFGKYELLGTLTDDTQQAVCRQKAEDALIKNPDLVAIVGLWAYNPPAMLEALTSQKKVGKVALIGFDEDEQTLKGLKDGHIVGTVVQDPFNFGYESVKIMSKIVKGESGALDLPGMNAQKQYYIRHRIVNADGKAAPAFQDEKVEAVDPFSAKLKELKGK